MAGGWSAAGKPLPDTAAPSGGFVVFLECYFDESGTDESSPILCVAGYLFEKERCKALDLKWKEVLDQYSLPFFRMSACAHNTKPFNHLSRDECIAVEKKMIALIGEHAMLGVAVTVNEAEYETWFNGRGRILAGDAYTYCCWQCWNPSLDR